MGMMRRTARDGGSRIPEAVLVRAAESLRTLAHPQRLRIVECLVETGEAPVHAIMAATGLAQAAASQHVNHLRRVGLLAGERRGQEVWYRIADPRCRAILACLAGKGEAQ